MHEFKNEMCSFIYKYSLKMSLKRKLTYPFSSSDSIHFNLNIT